MKSNFYSYDFLPDILEGEKHKPSTDISENNDLINNKELFSLDLKKQRFDKMVNMPINKIKEIKNIQNILKDFNKIKPHFMSYLLHQYSVNYITIIGTLVVFLCLIHIFTNMKIISSLFIGVVYLFSAFIFLAIVFYQDMRIKSKLKKYFKNYTFNFSVSEFIFINNNELPNVYESLDFLLEETNYDKNIDLDCLFNIYRQYYLNKKEEKK